MKYRYINDEITIYIVDTIQNMEMVGARFRGILNFS